MDKIYKSLVHHFEFTKDLMIYHMIPLCKNIKPSYPNKLLKYKANSFYLDLCPVNARTSYLSNRKGSVVKSVEPLFVTYGKPHHSACITF